MIPEEEFAAKRTEAEQLIRQHAPQRLQEQLISLLRPAIALTATRTEDARIEVGASKFGGAPDVPAAFEWPTSAWNNEPLLFLAQINLEEVAPLDVQKELPSTGLLSFFYGIEEGPCENLHQVFWFNEQPLHRIGSPTTPVVETCIMSFAVDVDRGDAFEELEWEDFQLLLESEKSEPDYVAAQAVHPVPSLLKLLGHPDPVFGGIHVSRWDQYNNLIEPEPQKGDYQLLLQVDSDDTLDVMWCDNGLLYFLIRKEDLAAQRFDRVHVETAWG